MDVLRFTLGRPVSCLLSDQDYRSWMNSSIVSPISLQICRSKIGEISLPEWKGTVVPRPSKCRNCLCEPRCRTSSKPSCVNIKTIFFGLRTGILPILCHHDCLCADEFGFKFRNAVLKEQLDDLFQIPV